MSWFRRSSSFNAAGASSSKRTLESEGTTPENELLFQGFEWHTKSESPSPHETHNGNSHWSRLTRIIPSLGELGVSAIWLPPGCKANNPKGNGYDCYDLWDLGEFDQKWARSTKWGSREELRDLQLAAQQHGGIELIWDAVLNHKTAGDATDETWAVEVDGEDRRVEICPPKKIEAWLKFEFPGREREGMKYSTFKWTAEHFNGTDWDQRGQKNAIFKLIDDPSTSSHPFQDLTNQQPNNPIPRPNRFSRFNSSFPRAPQSKPTLPPPPQRPGKGWATDVDQTFGNHDYLMFSNIHHSHPQVREDLLRWGEWMITQTRVQGFRLDAAQHFSWNFTRDWIARVRAAAAAAQQLQRHTKPPMVIGEVWAAENSRQVRWLDAVTPPSPTSSSRVYAFDAPLHFTFSRISEDVRLRSPNADLRTLLTGPGNPDLRPLVGVRPNQAVTLVTSHDTQVGQTCYVPMDSGLKGLFYAFILLRKEGFPCVFWGDLYGTLGEKGEGPAGTIGTNEEGRSILPGLMVARKMFGYGKQRDYFDNSGCVGWVREGTRDRSGCAVIMGILSSSASSSCWASKRMRVGRPGEKWVDVLSEVEGRSGTVIDKKGFGAFTCKGTGVGVFVREDAPGVEKFPVAFNHNAYEQ